MNLKKIGNKIKSLLKSEYNEINDEVCLSDTEKIIFKMLFVDDYTPLEIAQVLNKNISYINIKISFLALKLEKLKQLQLNFNVKLATKEELIKRCKKLGKNQSYIDFCVDAFYNKLLNKELSEKYFITEKTAKEYKRLRKKDLENSSIH